MSRFAGVGGLFAAPAIAEIAGVGATACVLSLLVSCSEPPASTPTPGSGGFGTGGASLGGSASGATSTGGISSGGVSVGGQGTGGVSALGGSAGNSSGGGGTGGSAIPPTFETIKYIIPTCFGASCHNEDTRINFLNLQDTADSGLHEKLLTTRSKYCGPIFIVTPFKPEESALFKILKGPCNEAGTTLERMPLATGCVADGDPGCVTPEYMKAIEQWILDGALK
jgi:hypothetical protein